VILILCAFKAEYAPLRARLRAEQSMERRGLRGCYGQLGEIPVALAATGIGMRLAAEGARRVLDIVRDVELVIATGVAGALAGGLPVGAVVLADHIFARPDPDGPLTQIMEPQRDWYDRCAAALNAAGIKYHSGPMLTSLYPITTAVEKRRAGERYGAIAVDMESSAIAQEAAARGLPFVCMRTILDTAGHDLAGAELADEEGSVRRLAAVKALITNPRMLPDVIRLAHNLRLAVHAVAAANEAVLRHLEKHRR
jgi:nucleoside phosphorylase